MAFDPDKYLASKNVSSGFDPDAFLAKKQPSGSGFLMGAAQALPFAGGALGGLVGSGLGPAGTAVGAGLGAAGGKALENVIKTQVFGEEKSPVELYTEPVTEGLLDATLTGAGVAAAKGVGAVVRGGRGILSKYMAKPMVSKMKDMGAPMVENADDILSAASRLNVKPTRGMLTSSPGYQKLESTLAQSPSGVGQEMADQFKNLRKGLQESSETLLPSKGQTAIEASETAKGLIQKSIEKSIEPAVEVYKRIENEVPFMDLSTKSTQAIARNIENLPFAKISGSQESSFAKQMAENVRSIKTVDELRNLKSYVGKLLGDKGTSSTMKSTAGEIYGRLSKMEQNAITRAALSAAKSPQHGRAVAKQMIGEIKGANQIYSQVSNDLKDLAQKVGMGKVQNYADFAQKMNDMSDEKFVAKFFNPGNYKALLSFQKQFPQGFETLKAAKMGELYRDSVVKGEISPQALIRNAEKLSPEVQTLLFGPEGVKKLKDIKTVYNAIYSKAGPSGTPEGMALREFSLLRPSTWYRTLEDSATKYMLERPELFEKGAKVLEKGLMPPPVAPKAATYMGRVKQNLPSTLTGVGLSGVGRAVRNENE